MQFDVLIVGGGLAGLSLACALRDSRLKIALIEGRPATPRSSASAASADDWDARIYALSPANAAFLDRIGAWKHLERTRLARVREMEIFGDGDGRLDFSAADAGIDELCWILESSQLSGELWENVKRQANVSVFRPAHPAALHCTDEGVELTLTDGETLSARLVVGADGRDSWVRQRAGLSAEETPYGELGVVANYACERPHRSVARQWFRADGVLAWLPLPGNRISIVWSTDVAHANTLLALPDNELALRVAGAGNKVLGQLRTITSAQAFPLSLLRVPTTIAPRVALIGDAAHGVHPLSGHGINLGFQDAAVLSELLGSSASWQDIGDDRLLRRYQRARREEILLLQNVTDGLHRLFSARTPGVTTLRNAGLKLTQRTPRVKNLLMRYALGAL
ncbi:UbiH/UbiF family hydroxylase [Rhodocyclus tenuis]|uniref:UbiH/UbiF family hydroxylase n=1 Tax=Rhodocyclus gracilis TaxID=2929842 RepID=UPI001298AD0E|nr:UbiH/UbiF family hydroxylase [Rhodocyclus gracilis]MRD72447.1 UbiH/UbiF family hydroxylase [Rhodocyclus gracilis]